MLYAWPEREKGGQKINGMRKSSRQERESEKEGGVGWASKKQRIRMSERGRV